MLVLAVVHVAVAVRSRVLPSVYVPVAVKACVVPRAKEGLTGATAIETRLACPTFSIVELLTEPEVAVIVAAPTPAPLASPVTAMVATVVKEELQLTEFV